jgi:hypothetical protein
MQLLHGLCCFDFISDIPLPPAALCLQGKHNHIPSALFNVHVGRLLNLSNSYRIKLTQKPEVAYIAQLQIINGPCKTFCL